MGSVDPPIEPCLQRYISLPFTGQSGCNNFKSAKGLEFWDQCSRGVGSEPKIYIRSDVLCCLGVYCPTFLSPYKYASRSHSLHIDFVQYYESRFNITMLLNLLIWNSSPFSHLCYIMVESRATLLAHSSRVCGDSFLDWGQMDACWRYKTSWHRDMWTLFGRQGFIFFGAEFGLMFLSGFHPFLGSMWLAWLKHRAPISQPIQ
jgi:hypothetical protein